MTTAVVKTKMLKYVPPETIPAEMMYFDAGGTTYHTHTCPEDGHKWMCNSPYCTHLQTLCPDHEGEEPVTIGREPWRR
jgi:hypothetical protein